MPVRKRWPPLFAVDLARAHQARLEALLGAPLPASLVEERGEER